MAKWDKNSFSTNLRETCSREVAKIAERIVVFSEKFADEITWGRGNEHATLTFRTETDFGVLPIFHLTSDGKINILVNFLRGKGLPPQVIRDLTVKTRSQFLERV